MAKKKKGELTGPRGGTSTVTAEGKVRTVVFLEPEVRKALKVAAIERECSGSDIVSAALRKYLKLE